MKYKIEPLKQDNTTVKPKLLSKPKPPEKTNTTSEFIFNPKTGKSIPNPNAKMGLENVSPEFALMTGGVGAGIKGIAGAAIHGGAQGAMLNAANLTGSKQDLAGLTTDILGGAVGGTALKGVGNLVKAIKPNVYKVNPFAFKAKSDMGYRMLGEEGFKDAAETGVLRAKPAPNPTNARISLERNINRNPNTGKLQGALDRPYFADGKIDTRYAADYMAEVNKSKNNLVPIDTHNGIAPMTAGNIPIENATLYKRDWLMGYKKINSTSVKPKSQQFKSEVNWGNWNKEIPNNPELLKEYHGIERTTKSNNTWMKNPDGSEFQGTPEQFVQQNSRNFKNSFQNPVLDDKGNIQYNYHGSPNKFESFDESKFKTGMFGKGIYTSPNKTVIEKGYAKPKDVLAKDHIPSKDDNLYELYIDAKNQRRYASVDDFMDDTDYADITHFGKRKLDFPTVDDIRKKYPDLIEQYNLNTDDKIISFYNNTFPRGNNITRDQFKEVLSDVDFLSFREGTLKPQVTPFHKARIKSAIGNNGMFDMTNPNIYKAILPTIGSTATFLNKNKNNNH